MLRFATAGSVDDGKSTLIGRLLYDSKSLLADQVADAELDLARLTDGLRAEREQGITIDVAYRFFATPRRSFIIADTPGHIQYTRNMVTGSSTANIALILVDARLGVLEQTKRHSFLASLLGVPHLVLCVNKMDLVDWSQERFDEIVDEFRQFATRLDVHDLRFVPVSALEGDNLVNPSNNMPWYHGPTVLELLEDIHVGSDQNMIDVRFPVQYVIRPHRREFQDFRGYAGRVAGGLIKKGDEVTVLPSGFSTRVQSIETHDGPVDEAAPPMSVVITLEDDIDVSRGDMICRPHNQPHASQDIDAMVAWMSEGSTLQVGAKYAIKHTTRWSRAIVRDLQYRLDVNSLHRDESADSLSLNEIGRIRLRSTSQLFFDEYRRNRDTGSFILVDEGTNVTVGAGMITGEGS